MKNKKKYFIFFLVLLFTMVLGIYSNCYGANRPITEDAIAWGIENITNNLLTTDFLSYKNYYKTQKSNLDFMATDNIFLRKCKNEIDSFLNNKNASSLDLTNMSIFCFINVQYYTNLYFVFHNSSAPNNIENLPYLGIDSKEIISGRNSKDNLSNDKLLILKVQFNSSTDYSFSDVSNSSISGLNLGDIEVGTTNYNDSYSYIFKVRLASFYSSQVGYCKVPLGSSTYEPGFFSVWSGDNLEPGSTIDPFPPSGEQGGETGGGTSSGVIEQELKNVSEELKKQNQKLEDINETQKETNQKLDDLNNKQDEINKKLDDINSFDSQAIGDIVDSYLSGDYSASSSILALNTAFFNSSDDGDLEISWDGIQFMGADLIPAGALNFTELVNSDDNIKKIYEYYQMFATISFGVVLIAGYYNLALAVLGLGSYFAMNTELEEETTTNLEDNSLPTLETRTEYYTRKLKHESNMRYNRRE